MTTSLDEDTLRAAVVRSGSPWVCVEYHLSIGSTNARAAAVGSAWHVVVADHQSAGRGRLTRTWGAPSGTSVAVSATVPLPGSRQGWLPLLAGLAVAEALESTTGIPVELKWPNDVLLPGDGGRKVCGILCEVLGIGPGALAVVGAGINICQTRDQLPVETATSLACAGVREVDRESLVAAYLLRLARWYSTLASGISVAGAAESSDVTRLDGAASGGSVARATALPDATQGSVREAYRSRCSTLGREVRLTRPAGPDVVGRAIDVDLEGRLVIESAGERAAWAAGDIVHARATGQPQSGLA